MKTTKKAFSVALAMMVTLTIGLTMAFGQDRVEESKTADNEGQDNALAGVWQQLAVPAFVDCQTGAPGPIINVAYTFNQGGTMYEEDTLSLDRYRTTGGGIWKRTSGRNYTYLNLHYAFDPAGTFQLTIKQRSNLTLSLDGNSFSEKGTFEGIEPGGNVIFAGCFAATAHRLTF